MMRPGIRRNTVEAATRMPASFLGVALLSLFCGLATPVLAQPGFDVRMQQEEAPKELRVSLALRGTEAFGLGDAVIAVAYDTLLYHRAELVSAPVFGSTPYRQIELHTAGDSLYVGLFYDYRTHPGTGKRIGTEWTEVAVLRFLLKTTQSPPMVLLRDAAGVLRDDGTELFLRAD
jgi:hypothetical protein